MHRSLITAGLALALLGGGLGFAAFSQTTQNDPAQPGERFEGRGRGHGQGLANAAAQLGVSEADLKAALGLPAEPPPRPDLATAATQLGISETDLREALRGDGPRGDRGQRLTNAATELGISEADLRTALGLPAEPLPRPDLATAAAELGVSEADLREALRSNIGRGPGGGCLGSEAES
ncbi:hypothetical protein C7293_17825 [filamentous cyanobacterium CCT1]|nr:hypothetical protein C7293_17825 [filamentous cyanobacterium CCT1]PSN79640.1 hypothetical protein C8B47_10610 [filamentous cyanobacterium CCP4]